MFAIGMAQMDIISKLAQEPDGLEAIVTLLTRTLNERHEIFDAQLVLFGYHVRVFLTEL